MKIKIVSEAIKAYKKPVKAWKRAYQPFRMGAHPYRLQVAELTGPRTLYRFAKGIEVYEINGPNGETVVIEKLSGGMVGDTIAQVTKDLKDAPLSVTRNSIKESCEEIKNSHYIDSVTQQEWWNY